MNPIRSATFVALLAAVFAAPATPLAHARVFRGVFIGPNYPGGGFDATIAATRATNLRTQFARWGNWNANNITLLTGAVTGNQITNAINNAGVGANDTFVLFYHGHGTYTGDNGMIPAAGDPPAELLQLPGATYSEGQVQAALNGLPNGSRKLFVNLSCFGGGMWDPLQNVNTMAFIAGCGERQLLPEAAPGPGGPQPNGQPFYWNLFQAADPTRIAQVDTNGDNAVSLQEWYNAARIANASVFGNRWGEPLSPWFYEQGDWESSSELHASMTSILNEPLFLVPGPGSVALLTLGAGLVVRRRR